MLHSSCCAHLRLLKDDLHDYTTRVKRTIREVLTEFRSLRIPKEYVFDVFPLLRPREFSIASSSKVHITYFTLVLRAWLNLSTSTALSEASASLCCNCKIQNEAKSPKARRLYILPRVTGTR